MINLLIVDDNLYFSKKLINFITDNNSQIRLYKVLTNGREALNIITKAKEHIDIILLDLKMPSFDGLKLLEEIKDRNLEEYKNSIIVISGIVDMISQIRDNQYVYTFIHKSQIFEKILDCLNEIIKIKEKKENDLEEKIKKELKFLKYSDRLVGTKYLYEAILLISKKQELYMKDLKNYIYPIIAKNHNVSVHNVKCNINNATTIMNCDCEKSIIMNYFCFFDEKTEVKPKQVIEQVFRKIMYG